MQDELFSTTDKIESMSRKDLEAMANQYVEYWKNEYGNREDATTEEQRRRTVSFDIKSIFPEVAFSLGERAKNVRGIENSYKSNVRFLANSVVRKLTTFHKESGNTPMSKARTTPEKEAAKVAYHTRTDKYLSVPPKAAFQSWFDDHDSLDYRKDFFEFLSHVTGYSQAGWKTHIFYTKTNGGMIFDGWEFETTEDGVKVLQRPMPEPEPEPEPVIVPEPVTVPEPVQANTIEDMIKGATQADLMALMSMMINAIQSK